jgi:hypothetical protein
MSQYEIGETALRLGARTSRQIPAGGFDIRVERDDAAHVNDFESLGDGPVGAGKAQRTPGMLHFATATDQHANTRAVDGSEAGEIDHYFAASLSDEPFDGCLGVSESVAESKASGDLDDGGSGLDHSYIERVGHAP